MFKFYDAERLLHSVKVLLWKEVLLEKEGILIGSKAVASPSQ